ncbi:MAG: hypothetical protein ACFFAN_03590 [Promethearchaeota archaeon]
MSELEKIKKIIEAHSTEPKKCPYCFRKLKAKLFKPDSSVKYYCPVCEQYIDLEWDYLHAIALKCEKYLICNDENIIFDFKKVIKE